MFIPQFSQFTDEPGLLTTFGLLETNCYNRCTRISATEDAFRHSRCGCAIHKRTFNHMTVVDEYVGLNAGLDILYCHVDFQRKFFKDLQLEE